MSPLYNSLIFETINRVSNWDVNREFDQKCTSISRSVLNWVSREGLVFQKARISPTTSQGRLLSQWPSTCLKYTSILGLGYSCSLLCDRVVCYRLFEMQEGDENSDIIEKCSTDASVTGYDHFIWAPKERLQKCNSGVTRYAERTV